MLFSLCFQATLCLFYNYNLSLNMSNQDLPDYKLNFLREMEELRQQQLRDSQPQGPSILAQHHQPQRAQVENNIINTAQYSSADWKQLLNQSSYSSNHGLSHYELNSVLNPDVVRKKHNIQLTAIAEYSNAMHNKTVFINPKNTSC